jgi:hypothetical protein
MTFKWFACAGGFAFFIVIAASYLGAKIDGRIAYQETKSCYAGGLSHCDAYFPKVPANKRLVLEKVTAMVQTNSTLDSLKFYGGNIQDVALKLTNTSSGGSKVYAATMPLITHLNTGDSPNFAVSIAGGAGEFSSTTMTIKGYLVDVKR